MTIKRITVNGKEFEFVNDSRNTRNGFAHDTKLFVNDCMVGKNSVNYLNRTWESYEYQTAMRGCVNGIIAEKYDRFIDDYKRKNNIKRLTAEKREEADTEFEKIDSVKELREVYRQLA